MNEKLIKANSSRRFISPTLTLSAMALGASAAHGSVVVTDFADVTSTGSYNWRAVVFNTTTGLAYTAISNSSTTRIDFAASGIMNFGKGPFWTSALASYGSSASAVSALTIAAGSSVGSGTSFIDNNYLTNAVKLTDAYFGVRMTAGDGYHYGWIKLSTGPDAGGGRGPGSITLKAAALETTANTAVTIPSAVPEPSSVLLLGLAAGAGAFRRRRSQAA